jgi:hypothetical protein
LALPSLPPSCCCCCCGCCCCCACLPEPDSRCFNVFMLASCCCYGHNGWAVPTLAESGGALSRERSCDVAQRAWCELWRARAGGQSRWWVGRAVGDVRADQDCAAKTSHVRLTRASCENATAVDQRQVRCRFASPIATPLIIAHETCFASPAFSFLHTDTHTQLFSCFASRASGLPPSPHQTSHEVLSRQE